MASMHYFMFHRFQEISIEKPSDALSIGQEIEAKVVDLNEADKKISLSIKALLNDNESSGRSSS